MVELVVFPDLESAFVAYLKPHLTGVKVATKVSIEDADDDGEKHGPHHVFQHLGVEVRLEFELAHQAAPPEHLVDPRESPHGFQATVYWPGWRA